MADVRLWDTSGIVLAEKLSRERTTFPVVLMANRAHVPHAVRSGVNVICCTCTSQDLAATIDRTLNPVDYGAAKLRRGVDRLTRVEQTALAGIIAGKGSREIAYDPGISIKTVESHRSRMNSKIRSRDVGELIRMWNTWQEIQ